MATPPTAPAGTEDCLYCVPALAGISHAGKMRPVEIVDYDPSWPGQFVAEHDALLALLGDLVDGVHHIGSTSVPGLAAKPKIDMDVVLRADGRTRGIRLNLCGPGNDAHGKRILFRDWLRTHPEDAAAYETLKRRLAAEANGDFAFYAGGKSRFVAAIVERAQMSRH